MRVRGRVDHQEIPVGSTLVGLRVDEGLSSLFDLRVELLAPASDLDLEGMLWSTMAVQIAPSQGTTTAPRAWHGVVEEARYLGSDERWHRYAFRLRPTLNGLARRVRTRIFQDLSAVDIVTQVLNDAGVPADQVRWDTAGEHPVRTYTTQWKESELAFVQRLLEDEGIFFWFEHSEVDHVLCFGDDPSVHHPIEGDPVVPIQSHETQDTDAIWHPILHARPVHDAYRSRDWFFETPNAPLQADTGEAGVRLRYEYPGGYETLDDGARLAAVRLEEAWRDRTVLAGEASCLRFAPGRKVDLIDVQPEPLVGAYLLTRVVHEVRVPEREIGGASQDGHHTARFWSLPADVPFRPLRATPKPVAHGLESAVVTGPAGEEIHVDEHGRIKVHFYWDRENPVDDTASCWIRFAQLNTQGAMILPRLGWEVHVAFVDGDPDRPVALHKVYNQETMPPYGLPGNKTQMSLQSSTSPGGGSTNEIRMQDGNGGMEWFLHGSKDLNVVVANDEAETVGVNATESVGSTMSSAVGGDEAGSVGGDQAISVSANAAEETAGSKTVSVGGNDDWGITGNFGFATGGDRTETIGGLMNVLANEISETVNGSLSRTVGAVQTIASATAIAETVGGSKTETVSAAKAIVTPGPHGEKVGGLKTLNSGAATFKTGGDVTYGAKAAIAVTAAGVIQIECGDDAMFSGSQVRVTAGSAKIAGGGGSIDLGGSITVDAKKFGGKGGPMLNIKGTTDYK
ncbi:MAG TPA: type VI secretion system tip protein TssI/VgrG [Sandaracinaceae bacterium LLY-WYZ-13_1]|nr:type VI secretion system tip protein TssI/VgrG [Sandaracinaceae bacterium LLY-WYZ-13_1]